MAKQGLRVVVDTWNSNDSIFTDSLYFELNFLET